MFEKEKFKQWLSSKKNGRQWLADQCGVKKPTVEGWCSNREIPGPSRVIIETLMQADLLPKSHVTVPFTGEEFALIQHALSVGQYTDVTDFARAALKEKAKQLTQAQGGQLLNESSEAATPAFVTRDATVKYQVRTKKRTS